MAEQGSLSINSENMFPIIKKWLYSDHDIFYREVISNGCDAITKLHKLMMMGDAETDGHYKGRIDIVVDPKEKTIEVSDNGLGMTADEVKEYINNIAFSGAEAFLAKYKDKASNDQIIGHFGLGFYSTFMVADLVEIDTLSYQKGAKAVHWECDGSSTYSMDDSSSRKSVGTTITLHVTDDCLEFTNFYKAKEVIQKYCGFMPYEIYLSERNTDQTQIIKESERRPEDIVIEEIQPEEKPKAGSSGSQTKDQKDEKPEEKKLKIRKRPELVNDTNPLWMKAPKDCTEEEYKEFYRKLFNDYKEPLFWIHLNMDYPFRLKGILYFPKINLEYESAEGVIKLYNNQVFIADNIKEVVPEFLMVLKGVIDCPDLPLNVSRSALQNDGFAQKISDYISKKVAEKLAGMCRTEKDQYDKYWDDISPFIKYGCLKDEKFCERMTDYILLKDLDGQYHTLPEALDINKEAEKNAEQEDAGKAVDENGNSVQADIVDANGNPIRQGQDKQILGADGKPVSSGDKKAEDAADKNKTSNGENNSAAGQKGAEQKSEDSDEKKEKTIYYVTDTQQQGQYIRMFRAQKMQAFILDSPIDVPFIQQIEAKNEGIHFERIDADIDEALQGRTGKKAKEQLEEEQKTISGLMKKALKNDKLNVKVSKLKDKKTASILTVNEQTHRMVEMMKMYSSSGADLSEYAKEGETLVLNSQHPLVEYIAAHPKNRNTKTICEQLYDLARIQNAPLTPDEMQKFITRTNDIMLMLAHESGEEVKSSDENAAASDADAKAAEDDAGTETAGTGTDDKAAAGKKD